MEKYQCIPNQGITNDYGADLNDSGNFKFYVDESALQDISVPDNCVDLVKQYLANNQVDKCSTSEKKSKLTDTQKAFPLEDETSFWTRLLKTKNSDKESVVEKATLHSSYISFSVNTSLENQQENDKLVLNENLRKVFDQAAPGDEKLEIKAKMGKKALARHKKAERDKTKGSDWYDMKAPEMTEEVKRDLEILQMRNAIDPKRFYKKNDRTVLPKYFQIGQYVDGPLDRHSNKGEKKSKSKSLVDELMADAEFKKYNKRKYTEIIEEKSRLQPQRYRGKSKSRKAEKSK